MSNPKVILVTGCAGFIGSNFIEKFKKEFPKTKIIGIDNFSTGKKNCVDKSIIFYKGSILNKKLIEKIFSVHKPEYVFHFAALPRVSYSVEHPTETSKVNILGSILLLETSKNHKVKRFIYSSSAAVYGNTKKIPVNEEVKISELQSPYAVQKYTIEPFCKTFSMLYEIDTVCLRYFNVFGPGQYGNSPYSTVISAWLESIYFPKKQKPFIEGNGEQSRDFCYVDNIVSANILAMKSNKKLNGEIFNVGCGEEIKVKEVKNLIEKYSKKKLILEKRPARLGDIKRSCADISKIKKTLEYKPRIKFREGLVETIKWFESRGI
jgi:UDP-glucose 4-epimerase